jgi:type II secretion system protein C
MELKAPQQLRSFKYLLPVWYNQKVWQEKLILGSLLLVLFLTAGQLSALLWSFIFPPQYQSTVHVASNTTQTHDVYESTLQKSNTLGQNTWFGVSPELAVNQMEAETVAVETALNLSLKGTIMGSNPQAFIVDNETGKTHLVKLDEEVINGVTLASVDRRQVVLTNNGKRETLSLPSTMLNGISHKKAEPEYTVLFEREAEKRQLVKISSADVEYALGNLGALSTEAKFIPRVAGGTVEGYKIMKMKNNSFLRKLSLKERDILLKLDDVLISDKAKLFPMLMDLKNASKARLLIHRGGENIALDVQVAN